jgi:hypothetical protein
MMRHRQPEFVKIAGPCKFTSRLQVSIGKDSIVQQQSCFPYPLSLFDIDVKSVLKRNDGDVSGILAPGAGSLRKQALMQINDHALPQRTLCGEHTLDAEVREQCVENCQAAGDNGSPFIAKTWNLEQVHMTCLDALLDQRGQRRGSDLTFGETRLPQGRGDCPHRA